MIEWQTTPYVLTKEEFLEFQKFHSRQGKTKLANLYIRLPVYALLLGLLVWAGILGIISFWAILPLVVIIVGFTFYSGYTNKVAWQRIQSDPAFGYPSTARINKDEINWGNHASQGNRTWITIYKIAETDNAILIYIRENMAIIIPKRAFATSDEASAFFHKAIEFQQAAQSVF
ncbi:YcxB family protein [Asticcacaulis sp. EMRT-3]|uniref:YcxB family protein n=1 Tax=Asticcacaulis sp. EMRT-3 TaxID=3040349 RepID=UPI0024AF3342|nr:YcxB family protein [Asticcacaulis sp. EMRT-3]MDI7775628.1 YcxB family protein [Asticcacaulis sp. EMRT-3]